MKDRQCITCAVLGIKHFLHLACNPSFLEEALCKECHLFLEILRKHPELTLELKEYLDRCGEGFSVTNNEIHHYC